MKARVERPRARVAASANDPGATRFVSVTRTAPKARVRREPLFVLTTTRRRRARASAARGGYYSFSKTRKPRTVPRPLAWMTGSCSSCLFVVLGLVLAVGTVLWGGYEYFAKDLPSIEKIDGIDFETTRIYDRYGNLLHEMFDPDVGKRTYITINAMPSTLISATIATEDKSFAQNSGVDPEGIARAAYINFTNQGSSGGSTITQQLVRRILLPERDERTWARKIREAILAVRVTEKYSKEKILEIYLNEIYYGSLSYGVAAAADSYWGKKVKDLTLAESAMLAGLPQAPGEYDPNYNYPLAKARQKIVLGLMVENGFITQVQADAAYSQDVRPVARAANVPRSAPHFVQYVQQVLTEKYGPEMANRGGLKVFTTIDLNMQAEAQRIASAQIENIKRQRASNAGLVAINPRTGEILAMVGSVDFTDPRFGQVNVATALRQPGSSFKPFTYATALQTGEWHPYSILADIPARYTNGAGLLPYVPQNYDGRFHGAVTIKSALANSYNIPAVEMLREVGVPAVLETAHNLGITTLNEPERYGLALTLGGGEVTLVDMTAAFATLANYGFRAPATPFIKIADSDGNILYELNRANPVGKRALDAGVAYQISEILSDNEARTPIFGPNSPLKIPGIVAAAKTGTTNDWKDSWAMGYTPALAVGVWVGNNDGRPMAHVAGAIGAAPIWHNFIKKVYSDPTLKKLLYLPHETELPDRFTMPTGMVGGAVCAVSGMAPGPACTHLRQAWFTQGNLPHEACTWHKWVTVTLSDGGATIPGPDTPKSDTIERVYTFAPPQLKGWVGGGPPTKKHVITPTVNIDLRPTPVITEPDSIAAYVTPVAIDGAARQRPPGLLQPEGLEPIPGLQLAITSPAGGQVLSGLVMVTGQAHADNFGHYHLEAGSAVVGASMTSIAESSAAPLFDVLGMWNTDGLAPGPYILRLTMETTDGQIVRTEQAVRVGTAEPSVSIVSPTDGSPIYDGEIVEIVANADGGGAQIAGVEIYADGRRISSLFAPPWTARWTTITGTHELSAVMYTLPGERAVSSPVRVTYSGDRPTPAPTRAPIMWISNLTLYKDIPAGINDVWVDVAPNSQVHHVDIYINGYPAGYATGPGFRVNPKWTSVPGPPEPTATLEPDAAATAAVQQATANARSTRVARAQATKAAQAAVQLTAQAASARATAESANATASVVAATTSPTPTEIPPPPPTATFVRYEKLPDPMLGDFVARCRFDRGRHRVTAIGYDENNVEVGRDETWVVVR